MIIDLTPNDRDLSRAVRHRDAELGNRHFVIQQRRADYEAMLLMLYTMLDYTPCYALTTALCFPPDQTPIGVARHDVVSTIFHPGAICVSACGPLTVGGRDDADAGLDFAPCNIVMIFSYAP